MMQIQWAQTCLEVVGSRRWARSLLVVQASPVQVHAVADQPQDEQVAADVPLQGGTCLKRTGQPAGHAPCGSDTDAASLHSILKHGHTALQSTGSKTHVVWRMPTRFCCSIMHLEAGPMKPLCRRAARRKPQLKPQMMCALHVRHGGVRDSSPKVVVSWPCG